MHVHIEEKLIEQEKPIELNENANDHSETEPGHMADPLRAARMGREAVSCGVPPLHISGHRISTHRCTDIERTPSE